MFSGLPPMTKAQKMRRELRHHFIWTQSLQM
jgi:hypothetical protein